MQGRLEFHAVVGTLGSQVAPGARDSQAPIQQRPRAGVREHQLEIAVQQENAHVGHVEGRLKGGGPAALFAMQPP